MEALVHKEKMMKKNQLAKALRCNLEAQELHDPSLKSIVGGCGEMGGGGNFLCGPIATSNAEGSEIGKAVCPAKPIFTGRARNF